MLSLVFLYSIQAADPVAPGTERVVMYEFLAGAAAAAVTVPLTVALGTWMGSLSNHLVGATLPALILLLALPPLIVTGVAYWAGNAIVPGSAKFSPAVFAALGVQALALVVTVAIGASSHDIGAIAAFTGAEMILLPGIVSGMMHLTRPKEMVAPVMAWSF